MMEKKDCFLLGYITKVHGYKGKLVFYLDVDTPVEYYKMESVLIDINNIPVPFFIDSIEPLAHGSNEVVVKLTDIKTLEEAEKLVRSRLYQPLGMLPPLTGNKFYFHEIIDFDVIDEKHGHIGKVHSVIEMPQYGILAVHKDDKEMLVPAIDEFITKVCRKERKIQVQIPGGMLDIYSLIGDEKE